MPGFEQVPATPEQQTEALETGSSFESPAPVPEQAVESVAMAIPQSIATARARPVKDPTVQAVESVLEEDLGEAFQKMNPALQQKFRKEGERITAQIVEMVKHAKINARVVLKLLTDWLKMIPGVNHFFLTQEAKIKTDRILKL